MKSIQTIRLGDVTEIARGSSPRPIRDQAYFDGGNIPWIKIADATASTKFIFKTKQYVNEYGASFYRKLPAGSLIVAASGTLGFAIFLGVEGCVHDGWLYFKRIDEKRLNKDYLYFVLNTLTKSFNSKAYGAAIQNINTKILRETAVPLPEITVQKKIAAVVTAYDDLIQTNKRRIALLEKMVEELYREWFVRMRFPGRQNSKLVKGVPSGWSFDLGSKFFDHVKGKSYSSREISNDEGSCYFITLKSFRRRGGYRKEGLKYFSGSYKEDQCVEAGDVVMAVTDMTQDRAVVGEVARIPKLPGKKSVISLDVIRLIPKDMPTTFLYAYMRHSGFANYIKEFANGANVLHLKPDLVGKQRLLFPPKHLRERFSDLADPIYQETGALEEANAVLTQTRDLLLPRLISGKLSVEDLNIQLPPSMQKEVTKPESAHA